MEKSRIPLDKLLLTMDSDVIWGGDPDIERDLSESIEDIRRLQDRQREDRQAQQRIRARQRAAVDINGSHRRKRRR